jgi:hypothetical protein
MSFVYFIRSGDFVKIGKANNPRLRLRRHEYRQRGRHGIVDRDPRRPRRGCCVALRGSGAFVQHFARVDCTDKLLRAARGLAEAAEERAEIAARCDLDDIEAEAA